MTIDPMRTTAWTAALLLGALVSLGSQAPPASRPATAVRVELYPTSRGAPVTDLAASEVELLEDGVPQTVTSFERVVAGGPDRPRLFVLFIDLEEAPRISLVRFLDRLLTPGDRVTVVTPTTVASELPFGTKADAVASLARGEVLQPPDPKYQLYRDCYPDVRPTSGMAAEMVDRRRELRALDALDRLVARLDAVRGERKAVLTVSDGWQLFRENRNLARVIAQRPAASDPFGRRRGAERQAPAGIVLTECEADRSALAAMNSSRRLRDLAERANRATVTFYPVAEEALDGGVAGATSRNDSLTQLAVETDGAALIAPADVDRMLQRVLDDLSGYYLAEYSSTNGRVDGAYRAITVRTRRPDVQVRTRRGYRAATAWELTGTETPLGGAFAAMSTVSDQSQFRLRVATWPRVVGGNVTGTLWVAGELDASLGRQVDWTAGATAEIVVASSSGEQLIVTNLDIDAGEGVFTARFEDARLAPGEYAMRARVRSKQAGTVPLSAVARIAVPSAPAVLGGAVLLRRGPITGPRYVITADPRYRRTERIRLEVAVAADGPASARLLDQRGQPLRLPVAVTERIDEMDGFRWIVADLSLAPLAVGNYAIQLELAGATTIATFSVVP